MITVYSVFSSLGNSPFSTISIIISATSSNSESSIENSLILMSAVHVDNTSTVPGLFIIASARVSMISDAADAAVATGAGKTASSMITVKIMLRIRVGLFINLTSN